jgi:mono/diheme cytochrome c family protein
MSKVGVFVGALLGIASAVSIGCSDDSSGDGADGGGSGGKGGATATGGKGGATATGGKGGLGGTSSGGASAGGAGGSTAGSGGVLGTGGSGGAGTGGTLLDGGAEAGPDAAPTDSGATDSGDAHSELVARGAYLVRSVSLCGGCHTSSGGPELAGNPKFKNGALPAPNLTPHASGIGNWSDPQIVGAIRNGVDDEGRHLDAAMPYWLFHNLSDVDAASIVAFLRSLPAVDTTSDAIADNPEATPVTPLALAGFPATSLASTDANYAAAQTGRYLLAGAAQCVKCHSPSAGGLPAQSYFSGVAPTSGTQIFASNITPDVTGISGWVAADVATALRAGKNKNGATLCGSMPSASKGYGGLTDADANAIGVYLTTIPAVSNAAAKPSLEPPCP